MGVARCARLWGHRTCRHATCAKIIAAAPRAEAAAQTMSTARSVRIWKCEFQREHASNDAELSYVTFGISFTSERRPKKNIRSSWHEWTCRRGRGE